MKKTTYTAFILSSFGLASTQDISVYNIKKNFPQNVLKDTQEIRNIRQYKKHTDVEKKQYDKKVIKVADCFLESQKTSKKWNETQIIIDIHECAIQNDYPKIMSLDKNWEYTVAKQVNNNGFLIDILRGQERDSLLEHYTNNQGYHEKIPVSNFSLARIHNHDNSGAVIAVNNNFVSMIDTDIHKPHGNATISRTPFVQTDTSQYHSHLYKSEEFKIRKALYNSNTELKKHLDEAANTLLDGNFQNQNKAINLLLNYKILTSLPFAVENQFGTQFKNIIKMNYLTDKIKEKYPTKVNPNLNIPHIVDYAKFDDAPFLKNPEIAVITLLPHEFYAIQKKQINTELKKFKKNSIDHKSDEL